jgi:hypothetical protein
MVNNLAPACRAPFVFSRNMIAYSAVWIANLSLQNLTYSTLFLKLFRANLLGTSVPLGDCIVR